MKSTWPSFLLLLISAVPALAAPASLPGEITRAMNRLGAPLGISDQQLEAIFSQSLELSQRSVMGRPLAYWQFEGSAPIVRTILFVGGIHPNEVSAVHGSFKALEELVHNPASRPPGTRLVFAALTNPDGLLKNSHPTRQNANGVDLNRGFKEAAPEPEVRFIQALIAKYDPSHIIALHSPFGWLDYDGPAATSAWLEDWQSRIVGMARAPLGVNNGFQAYPGSLGGYAGTGLGKHVLTFELPHAEAEYASEDWDRYGAAVLESLKVE